MARGSEFQIVGAATVKLREPKRADTGKEQQFRVRRMQGTRWSVMFKGWIEVGRLGSRYGFVGNAGDLELDAPV